MEDSRVEPRIEPVEKIYKDKPESFIKDFTKNSSSNLDTYEEYQKRANEELKKKEEENKKRREEILKNAKSSKEEYENAVLRNKRPRIKQEERDDR